MILGTFYYGFERRHEFIHDGQEERFKAAAENAALARQKIEAREAAKRAAYVAAKQ